MIALASCLYLPFFMSAFPLFHRPTLVLLTVFRMSVQQLKISTMTAAWLLPIVSTIVAAASGGIVANVLLNPQHALWTLVTSYILWGTGVPLAMVVLVIYFQRLTFYHIPPREVIVSVFLPLGPLGQGGFGIMQLGSVARDIFPKTGTLSAATTNSGEILYVVGWLMATIMWGFAVVWLFFAAATISRSPKFPFNMGWWGFTFPLGVFTTSTVLMGKELPSKFFDVLGTVSFVRCINYQMLLIQIVDILRGCYAIVDPRCFENSYACRQGRHVLCTLFTGSEEERSGSELSRGDYSIDGIIHPR